MCLCCKKAEKLEDKHRLSEIFIPEEPCWLESENDRKENAIKDEGDGKKQKGKSTKIHIAC